MNEDSKATGSAVRPRRRWRRFVVFFAFVIVLLWWPGVRLFYFAWITTFGTRPQRQTDFSRLSRVLPPPDATLVVIHRGLPHQRWASGELLRDLFTKGNRAIGGYRFYTSSLACSEALRQSLTSAMRTPTLYQPYRGPKLCGGYHPDYCLEWHSFQGTFYGLLCTGCHEMIIIGGGTEVHCDLNDGPAEDLEKLLAELK